MIWEWLSHTAFVLIILIGSIVALLFAYIRRSKRRA
ncbi:EYxxD motif small membrane protein [Neobacillus dielmonensis]